MLSSIYSAQKRNEVGFTLIELLIVVIVIGILAAIALPVFINQQKIAVDASVKSDVRNTVTNITNAQAQQAAQAKVAITRDETHLALSTAGGVAFATRAAPDLDIPKLGTVYTLQGWNAGGSKYLGTAAAGAFQFDSTTGQFTQSMSAAPSEDGEADGDDGTPTGPVGGGANSAPAFTSSASAPDAKVNEAYDGFTLVASGHPAAAFSVPTTGTGRLPAGLALDGTTGKITGTPTESGQFDVTVTATNSVGSIDQTLSITVSAAPAITNASELPEGYITLPYTAQLTTSGFPKPTFTPVTLNGVSLAADGKLSGQPLSTGGYQFATTVSNAAGSVPATFIIHFSSPPILSCSFDTSSGDCGNKLYLQSMGYSATGGRNGTGALTASGGNSYIGFTGYNFGVQYFVSYRINVWTKNGTPSYVSSGGTAGTYTQQESVAGWTHYTRDISGSPYDNFAMFLPNGTLVDDVSVSRTN